MTKIKPKHEFTIKCEPCQKGITESCIMEILEFMTQHKECLNTDKEAIE